MDRAQGVAIATSLICVVLIARRIDVRLVLGLGALPVYLACGRLPDFVGQMAKELSNAKTIVPICSAVGFSYVLRRTGCDAHLVRLLVRPLRAVRVLVVPGAVAAGYVVNMTIVSQTGAAAVVGPILLPVLRASGADRATAGAALLLGCSMGGELFNPGAVEVDALASRASLPVREVVRRTIPLNVLASGASLVIFWVLVACRARSAEAREVEADQEDVRVASINPLKAAVPLVPLGLLFLFPKLVHLPERAYPAGLEEPVQILAAMLLGVAVAAATAPREAARLGADFFEGAGYGYTHVISLIVMAITFAEAIRLTGLIDRLAIALAGRPGLALIAAVLVAWFFAFLCGSGIAPAVAVISALVPRAVALGLDPIRLGGLTAMAAHFGRTMSPAAAVVAMCAGLAGADRAGLLRRVALPLLGGGSVLLVATLLGWL